MIELCEKKDCTGCGACSNICPKDCISMLPDREGFLYPSIHHNNCIECGACVKHCPILTPPDKNEIPKIYAGFHNDSEIRINSSSGGMFYALAQYIISEGGAVFGVAFDDDFTLQHRSCEHMDNVKSMMGSKYIQSNINATYKEVLSYLKSDRKVLFTGTPCQVAGCKAFIPTKYKENLLLVDIICHGVPSQKIFKDYLRKLSVEVNGKIQSFSFRSQDKWGVSPFILTTERKKLTGYQNIYMTLFLNGYTFRNCCYNCKYATTRRVGDLTIADFWGVGEEAPYSHDTKKGISLILINNQIGKAAITSISDNITIEERTLSEASRVNHQLKKSFRRPSERKVAYDYALSHSLEETYNYFFNSPYCRLRKAVGKVFRLLKLMK